MKTLIERRDELAEKSVNAYLQLIYKALDNAGITYSEDQLEHCAEDSYKAGFDASSDIWRAETKALVLAASDALERFEEEYCGYGDMSSAYWGLKRSLAAFKAKELL